MRTWVVLCVVILAGCADRGAANRMKANAFTRIREHVEEQARERPPATEREAKRLTSVADMCVLGHRLAAAELRICREPRAEVPDVEDFRAMEHAVREFEEDVEDEKFWRDVVEPFVPNAGLGNVIGAGGIGTIGLALLKILVDRKKMRGKDTALGRKDRALGKLFAFAESHSDRDARASELRDESVREEYRSSEFRTRKKEVEASVPSGTKT